MPFLPPDIAGLKLWLRADSLSLADGDPVTTWVDESGLSHDAVQSVVGKKPTYKTGIVNSLPVVRFDGTDDQLQSAFTLAQPITIFLILTNIRTSGTSADQNFYRSDSGGCVFYTNKSNSERFTMYGGSVLGSAAVEAGPVMWMQIWNGGSSSAYRNGVSSFAGNAGTEGFDVSPLNIGTGFAGLSPTAADYGEIIVYDSALGTTDRQSVEAYLIAKWFTEGSKFQPALARLSNQMLGGIMKA